MMEETPLVSVIMPVYNGAKYIGEAIDSILNQTYFHLELIIIDDGSEDHTPEIIKSYTDGRVKPYFHFQNKGAYCRLNQGLEVSTGEFIAIMDADDIAYPGRIEKQVNFLLSHTELAFCGTQVNLLIEPSGRLVAPKGLPLSSSDIRAYMLFFNPFVHPTILFKASVIKNNKYLTERMTSDYELWIRLMNNHEAGNMEEVLLDYRRHDGNVSSQTDLVKLKELFEKQLTCLKVPFSENELETHLRLSDANPVKLTLTDFEEIKNWLKKLKDINLERMTFDIQYFSKLLDLVYLECWLWKVQDFKMFYNITYCPIFFNQTSWSTRWKLIRISINRLRKNAWRK